MTNPYSSPTTGTTRADDSARYAHIAFWVGWSFVGLFVCCVAFTAYLFLRYPLLEDTAAGDHKSWPLNTLKPLAIAEVILAIAGGVTIGVSKGILKVKRNNDSK